MMKETKKQHILAANNFESAYVHCLMNPNATLLVPEVQSQLLYCRSWYWYTVCWTWICLQNSAFLWITRVLPSVHAWGKNSNFRVAVITDASSISNIAFHSSSPSAERSLPREEYITAKPCIVCVIGVANDILRVWYHHNQLRQHTLWNWPQNSAVHIWRFMMRLAYESKQKHSIHANFQVTIEQSVKAVF